MSKIQTWKRITTPYLDSVLIEELYLICQRYKLESESQPTAISVENGKAVFNMSKIQTWKRITTLEPYHRSALLLYLICQRYKLESESQQDFIGFHISCAVFNMSKIQTWKRITTILCLYSFGEMLYLICQRYKLESESQQSDHFVDKRNAVFNMSKIQTWKRITTFREVGDFGHRLYLICQRYKLESESQLGRHAADRQQRCI